MQWIVWIIVAYLVGSIPFGFLLGKLRGVDIREHGSRNIGATNVGRVLGRRLGTTCFVLDVLKGAAPVAISGATMGVLGKPGTTADPTIATMVVSESAIWLGVACAAVAGHMASIFLGFRGGKGVATSFGAMVAMWPVLTLPALGALVVWYGVLRYSRYVSVASIVAAVSLPLGYLLSAMPNDTFDQPIGESLRQMFRLWPPLVITALLAALVVLRHRANLARLRRGEEPKVGGATRRGAVLDGE